MIASADRAVLRTAAAKVRWRARNLRLAADELEAVAQQIDALLDSPPGVATIAPPLASRSAAP